MFRVIAGWDDEGWYVQEWIDGPGGMGGRWLKRAGPFWSEAFAYGKMSELKSLARW